MLFRSVVLHELEAMAEVLDRVVGLRDGRVVKQADGIKRIPSSPLGPGHASGGGR